MGSRILSAELAELGERIRRKRKELGWPQEKLAEEAGVSLNTVSRIEGSQSDMSIRVFVKILRALDTDAGWLLGEDAPGYQEQKELKETFRRVMKLEGNERENALEIMRSVLDSSRYRRQERHPHPLGENSHDMG